MCWSSVRLLDGTYVTYKVTGMSSLRDRRKRLHAKRSHAREVPTLALTLRTLTPLRRDTHVTYADQVSERRIDREAWANEVKRLIADEFDGNRAAFTRETKVGYKTVARWIDQSVDVSEESVRTVARALHIKPMDLLMRIGYYRSADIGAPCTEPPVVPADDEAMRLIEESAFPPRIKARMRQRLLEMRAQRAAAEAEEVRWWMEQAREA